MMCGESTQEVARPRHVPQIPLPRWGVGPFRLPSSISIAVAFLLLALVLLAAVSQRLLWPILMPVWPAVVAELGTPTVAPTRTALPTETVTPSPSATPTITSTPTETPTPVVHVVASGDNPGSIALKYGLTIEQVMAANDIRDPRSLRLGQELIIPPIWTPVGSLPRVEVGPTSTPMIYKVQPGDNLGSIAIWAGTTVEEIMRLNNLENPRWLSVGQVLMIPGVNDPIDPPTPAPEVTMAVRIIEPGDSLLGIALEYKTSVDAIMSANHLRDEWLIRAGDSLLVPVGTAAPTPSPTTLPTSTATPGPRYMEPVLLSPANGQYFWSNSEPVLLNWTSVGVLADNDWYVVEVRLPCGDEETVQYGWTRATSWRVPVSLCPGDGTTHRPFRWRVRILRSDRPDVDPAGMAGMSLDSVERTFYWY